MKRSKFTEEQIVGILREQEAGEKTADVCRRHPGCRQCAWSGRSEHHLGQRAVLAQTGRLSESKRSGQKSATILTSGGRPHLQPLLHDQALDGDARSVRRQAGT